MTTSTEFELHGTTAISLSFEGGAILAVVSRCSNEKRFTTKLKIRDNAEKKYQICNQTVGVMLGDIKDCYDMKNHLKTKCAHMKSVSDIFKEAEEYVFGFRGLKKKFGTILCSHDTKGPRNFAVYVNGDEVWKATDELFITLGTGSRFARKMASILSSGNAGHAKPMSLKLVESVNFAFRCLFDSTFHDISSGGTMYAYHVFNGSWECRRTMDILDAYDEYYDCYNEENILFLIVNCAKGGQLISDDLLKYFRSYGSISLAHRVATIPVKKAVGDITVGFFFHRLVCDTAEDASKIYMHVVAAPPYNLTAKVRPAVVKILKAFPYCVNINPETPVYVNRASRSLLELLRRSRI